MNKTITTPKQYIIGFALAKAIEGPTQEWWQVFKRTQITDGAKLEAIQEYVISIEHAETDEDVKKALNDSPSFLGDFGEVLYDEFLRALDYASRNGGHMGGHESPSQRVYTRGK